MLRIFSISFLSIVILGNVAFAATESELRKQITDRNSQIGQLEKEIAQYETIISEVSREKKTLQTTVSSLVATEKKLAGELQVTETKISRTNLTLEQTAIEIDRLEQKIGVSKHAVKESVHQIQITDGVSAFEAFLTYKDFGEAWDKVEALVQLQSSLKTKVDSFQEIKNELEQKYQSDASQKRNLESLKGQLGDQRKVVEYNKKEKDQLLSATQSKEAQYQRLLKEKEDARSRFESELNELETKLKYILDPSSIPQKGSGALKYPLENPIITQGFGLTPFALSGAYGYDAQRKPIPHRGVDFRASVGTKLLSPADGVVREAFDMDSIPGCYSYGQWILIDHDNGLSTLYAHLSVRSVKAGDPVKTGSIIGYTGNSGYSTGPHLHFSVFPREGVQVQKFSSSRGCKNALVPIAPLNAYLNPLDYLR